MKIANYEIGGNNPVFIIAEIGINHNGDLSIAKQLIKAAKEAGCDAVKFQKRTVEVVYTPEELDKPRENPFGATNGDLKRGLEFSHEAYNEIDAYCAELGILWFASPWDEASVDFLEQFNVPCHKIASPGLTDAGLLNQIKKTGKPVILSVGMSDIDEVDKAVKILGKDRLVLLQCVSEYPATPENINLRVMRNIAERYGVPVGYSGHEADTVISAAAVAAGACMVERHFTLDRNMWGTDHKVSINPDEMAELVRNIRMVEKALGDGVLRLLPVEVSTKEKLRRVNSI
jgi:N-acetylneuraminate synthase